jgi:hypothetical protein
VLTLRQIQSRRQRLPKQRSTQEGDVNIDQFLLIVAAICFGLAAIGVNSPIGLVPLGLLLWVLTVLI